MPIRINLLAEQQAAEEMRRKDPVKRTIMAGVALLALMLIWIASTQIKVRAAKQELENFQSRLVKVEEESKTLRNDQAQIGDIDRKIEALDRYADIRFFWGSLLDTVHQVSLANVRIMEITGDHRYRTNDTAKLFTTDVSVAVIPDPPAWKFWASAPNNPPLNTLVSNTFPTLTNKAPFTTNIVRYAVKITPSRTNNNEVSSKVEFSTVPWAMEQIVLQIRGRDYGTTPGAGIDEFAKRLTASPFFEEWMEEYRFTERPPQARTDPTDPLNPTAMFVPFTIECRLKARVFTNE